MASANFAVTLAALQAEEAASEAARQAQLKRKRELMNRAELRANAPIDDSAVVDDMFGFIDEYEHRSQVSQSALCDVEA